MLLKENGIDFFTGVPDSLLKDFCAYIADNVRSKNNIIAANEGGAVALAAGYHLATGKIGLVYMQNSGLGNSINPLLSLADSEVYGIPMLFVIGWRGEPGVVDEPQHIKQGRVTLKLLEAMGVPYKVIGGSNYDIKSLVGKACDVTRKKGCPYALVVKKDTFEPYIGKSKAEKKIFCERETALKTIIDSLDLNDVVVSTTGKISREIFEYRESLNKHHNNDFLTVGSMGHCSQIALGIALAKEDRNVYCLDGDGSLIMHMGTFGIIGAHGPDNLKHIVVNNGTHDSVGGQPTIGFNVDFIRIAKACGYKNAMRAGNTREIKRAMNVIKSRKELSFLEVKVEKGARSNLGRPTETPKNNKKNFMEFLKHDSKSTHRNR